MLRIYAVNDLYSFCNLPKLKSYIRASNVKSPATVHITTLSGDFLSPNDMSIIDEGSSMIRLLNDVPVDYISIGNHEFDIKLDALPDKIKEFNGKILNSNITSRLLEGTLPYDLIRVVDDRGTEFRVGIFGICTHTTVTSHNFALTDIAFAGHVSSATSTIAKLTEAGAQYIIAMTHLDVPDDVLLAKACPAIDLILGGHDHDVHVSKIRTTTLAKIHTTTLAKMGMDAQHVGTFDIRLADRTVAYKIENIENWTGDAPMEATIASFENVRRDVAKMILCEGDYSFEKFRVARCDVICSFLEVVRAKYHSDGVILNNSAIRPPRTNYTDLTFEDIHHILPYSTEVVSVDVPSALLNHIWNGDCDDTVQYVVSPGKSHAQQPTTMRVTIGLFMLHEPVIKALHQYVHQHYNVASLAEAAMPIKNILIPAFIKERLCGFGSFASMDLNGDGVLDRGEVKRMIKSRRKSHSSPCKFELDTIFKFLDKDKSGTISVSELAE
jgi:2',3'-cyclic-nucleotide 2'-phosphodiesterase (5'-nucleotidase family)